MRVKIEERDLGDGIAEEEIEAGEMRAGRDKVVKVGSAGGRVWGMRWDIGSGSQTLVHLGWILSMGLHAATGELSAYLLM